jgi:acetyl-CoA acetyltransferase
MTRQNETQHHPRLREVEVAGIGTTTFGKHLDRDLGSLAVEAIDAALADGRLTQEYVEHVVFSNAAAGVLSGQEMIRGQVALKGTMLAGLPVINTENACASGSAAAHLAWLAVASGQVDIAVAVGAEKLHYPDKARSFLAIESGTDRSLGQEEREVEGGSVMMGAYAREARRYSAVHGDVTPALTAIAIKNRAYAAHNPYAQFRTPITSGDIESSRLVAAPLRLLTCSPLTDGAAALVFRAADSTFSGSRPRAYVGASTSVSYGPSGPVAQRAADLAYRRSGLTPDDIDVFQLHDACAFAELLQYEQVGIAAPGEAISAILEGRTGPRGDSPVNTDGGLLSRGHPLGATGLAQLSELVRQLRGEADGRQVPDARRALCVNSGGWMGSDYATAFATLLTTELPTH